MSISLFLGAVLGWYLLIFSLMILFDYQRVETLSRETTKHQATLMLGGMIGLIIGLLVTVGHQVWAWDWRVIVTIFGWLVLIKGLMILLFPNVLTKWVNQLLRHRVYFIGMAIVNLCISLFLLYRVYF